MQLEWMGRYRELIRSLVYYGNMSSRHLSSKLPLAPGIELTAQEYQTLEYLIEFEEENGHMNYISERLGIPQSSLSKAIKHLCELGLVERFRIAGNRKNVIPQPTKLGRELYLSFAEHMKNRTHLGFFRLLETVDDEAIARVAEAMRDVTDATYGKLNPPPLIPLDREE